MKIDILNPNVR